MKVGMNVNSETPTEEIEQEMFDRATNFIEKRYPKGWGGTAVMYTSDGQYLISVAIETIDSNVGLCIETGALCEATKYDLRVTHSLCVTREDEYSTYKVLTPCGVCQERLRYYGMDVRVGVTVADNELKFVRLDELQPYHWTNAFDDIVMYSDEHRK